MEEKLRILLCEDDESLGMLLREYLQAKGYEAELFPDGDAGYKAFLKNRYEMCVLVRGKKVKETNMYKLGRFTFDTQRQILAIGDKQTKLTTKESELLSLLCAHANDVLQRELALKTIWIDDNYFNARSMDVYITKLRKHLKDDPSIEINNVHGKGYRLIIPTTEEE